MQRGISLLELLIVLVLVGLLAAIGAPALPAITDRLGAEAAALRLAAGCRQARLIAQLEGRVAVLRPTADSITVGVIEGSDTLPRWSAPGPAADGATFSGPAHPLLVAPSGLGLGLSNGTYHITRGAARRDVVISRLGRVRIVRF
jgi:prepilin-type N-terminal cleavage/methylation domain-containing protein